MALKWNNIGLNSMMRDCVAWDLGAEYFALWALLLLTADEEHDTPERRVCASASEIARKMGGPVPFDRYRIHRMLKKLADVDMISVTTSKAGLDIILHAA